MLSGLRCAICTNDASGFNYRVESCTGCRLFFRRSILKHRQYICSYKDKACIADDGKILRKNCKSCRYEVCISKGMRIDGLHIEHDYEALVRIQAIHEYETRHQHLAVPTKETINLRAAPTLIEETMQRLIVQLLVQHEAHEKIRRSTFLVTPMDQPRMDDYTEGPSKMGMHLIDQDWTLEMPYANVWKTQKKFWELCDIVYSFEYIKSFAFVLEMNREDRTIFLKSTSMLCTVLTRAWYSYQQRSEVTINPDGLRAYAKWKSVDDLNFDTYVLSQFYSMTIDPEEFAILKAVIILNPDIRGLSKNARQVIGTARQAHLCTLMSKCLARRGPVEGPRVYAAMLLLSPLITKQRMMRRADLRRVLIAARGTIFACPICEEMLAE